MMTLRPNRATVASAAIVGLIAPGLSATAAPAAASTATTQAPLPAANPTSLAPKLSVTPVQAPAVRTAPAAEVTYRVVRGDSFWKIARKFSVDMNKLAAHNGLTLSSIIHPGQMLRIPSDTPAAQPAAPKRATATAAATHKVARGETLSGIAKKYSTSTSELVALNKLANANRIYVGQVLKIASSGQATPAKPAEKLVPDTFLGRTYPKAVVNAANKNKAILNSIEVPSRAQMQQIVRQTANQMGVDPSLALAVAFQESSFNHRSVSPANAIGTMQVIPSSGTWASQLVGRKLNLIDPHDNAVAGVAILRQLLRTAPNVDSAIAGYYQGLGSVKKNGMFEDTKVYVSRIKAHQAKFR
ncbi:hypothetical protein BSZ39_05790 [Bowdeniella nasicola]|uniref:LysM domain-containing protein n=1 Tax=Bowdeniella nasicola TaxID=208480 RepID=A0A1Q5Q399_9ACTO|nr:LysM peptidoglycan-binding domain-containing protein [Bowdeniella nasicola]OKL54120.1 hypothetical protein BSZ39_05790 [Bowdeniella nasicola]